MLRRHGRYHGGRVDVPHRHRQDTHAGKPLHAFTLDQRRRHHVAPVATICHARTCTHAHMHTFTHAHRTRTHTLAYAHTRVLDIRRICELPMHAHGICARVAKHRCGCTALPPRCALSTNALPTNVDAVTSSWCFLIYAVCGVRCAVSVCGVRDVLCDVPYTLWPVLNVLCSMCCCCQSPDGFMKAGGFRGIYNGVLVSTAPYLTPCPAMC